MYIFSEMPVPKTSIGLRVDVQLIEALDEIADKLSKTRTDLIVEAIEGYWEIKPGKEREASEVYSKIFSDFYQLRERVKSLEKEVENLKSQEL